MRVPDANYRSWKYDFEERICMLRGIWDGIGAAGRKKGEEDETDAASPFPGSLPEPEEDPCGLWVAYFTLFQTPKTTPFWYLSKG